MFFLSRMAQFYHSLLAQAVLLGLFMLLVFFASFSVASAAISTKSVLLLHSYQYDHPWTTEVDRGIRAALLSSDEKVIYYTFFMDAQRQPLQADLNDPFFRDSIHHHFSSIKFDVIICSDDDAFNYVRHWNGSFFPETPVVFCGVNNFQPGSIQHLPRFTGIVETVDFSGTLKAAAHIQDNASNLIVFANDDATGAANLALLEKVHREEYSHLHLEVYTKATIEMALNIAQAISPNDIVLLMTSFKTKQGQPLEIPEATQLLTDHCSAPIFTNWDFRLNHGVIGGKITSGYLQGKAAGNLAQSILQGQRPAQLAVQLSSPTEYIFDWQVLQRFHIDLNLLPPESTLISKNPSLREEYPVFFWSTIVIIILSFVAIASFAYALKQKRHSLFLISQSKSELEASYTMTLEGWTKALDLRDHETEGHSQRVTNLTLFLAKQLFIPTDQFEDCRRGALLHDIGKLGIPDRILLKPGPLSPEEWVEMRKHPVYAYEWLHSIHYLRSSLDIPYCHHERWDGTGYPRGLKGEEIPLAARIFAVVDVWDALTSDRPYRKAWTPEKTEKYLLENAGTHFDPQVVEVFLHSTFLLTASTERYLKLGTED